MKSVNVLAILGIAFSSNSLADPLPLPQADSGLVTIFAGQYAQLNIANTDDPAKSCSFTMSFIDSTGAQAPASPGVTTLVGGASTNISEVINSPLQVRAHIDFTSQLVANAGQKDPMDGCYRLLPTFEVMDSTTTRVLNPIFYGMPTWKKGEKLDKLEVCHKPNTPAQKTLVLPMSALSGHLGHGDAIGACQE